MLEDAQGLQITTDSKVAVAAINRFVEQSLSYGKDAEMSILQAIAADPTCAIAHAYTGAYYLSLENATASKQAVPHLQTAQQHLERVTYRERLYIQAIIAWAKKEIERALALHQEIAQKFPCDLISVQQGQYHYFYLGNKERLLKIAQQVLPANRENHYLYGMIAFGLEQCYQLKEAEQMALRAIVINRHDPWAHHAIAHVMETYRRVDEGIAWMESYADTWENCNSMLYTHNWWHIALYYLAQGNKHACLALYDTHIWGRADKLSPKDQVGAISLLLRLELRGVDVSGRWQELSNHLYHRLHEHALAFQDLHYVYAMTKAGQTQWVEQMLVSMHKHTLSVNPFLRRSWLEVAVPTARGMVSYAKGDFNKAVAELKPVMPRLHEIGGSHAQRVLFEEVYLTHIPHPNCHKFIST
jgi:tetratricopeptide (TPR) repeat protein